MHCLGSANFFYRRDTPKFGRFNNYSQAMNFTGRRHPVTSIHDVPPLFLAPFSSSVYVPIVIAYDDTFSTLESYLPLEEDFRGANLALARLQKTYNIPVEELMNGVVAGRQAQPLSQREVFDVGQTLVSSNLPDDAVQWFVAGLNNNNNSPLVNRQDFYHALVRAHTMVCHVA